MPIYEYKCEKCGKEFEEFHVVSERHLSFCCGQEAKRLIPKSQAKPVVLEYYSEASDTYFTGPKQRDRILKEKNLACIG